MPATSGARCSLAKTFANARDGDHGAIGGLWMFGDGEHGITGPRIERLRHDLNAMAHRQCRSNDGERRAVADGDFGGNGSGQPRGRRPGHQSNRRTSARLTEHPDGSVALQSRAQSLEHGECKRRVRAVNRAEHDEGWARCHAR